MAPEGRDRTEAVGCRVVDVGGAAGAVGSRQRDRLAALRTQPSVPFVPVLAWSARVQQAVAEVRGAVAGDHPPPRHRHRRVGRRHLADRLDTDRVRPIADYHTTFQSRRIGRLRLLPASTRGGSGDCACISCAPRPDCRSRSPWPTRKSTNATSPSTSSMPNPACAPAAPAKPSSPTRATPRPSSNDDSPNTASNSSAPPAATPRRRGAPQLRTPPPDHRIGQQHPQSPAQPRRPRRPQTPRRHHAHAPTTPRTHHRALAQSPQPPARAPLPRRLRPPTTPWTFLI